jgi:hypothetical protein
MRNASPTSTAVIVNRVETRPERIVCASIGYDLRLRTRIAASKQMQIPAL